MKNKISVVVLEDEKNFRDTVSMLLNSSDLFYCGQTYETVTALYADFKNIHPNIFWIDLNLPDGSGIEVIEFAKRHRPDVLCIVCSFFDSEEMIFKALESGADGYLIKGESNKKILESLQELYAGGAPMSSTIAKKVLLSFRKHDVIREDYKLTKKEAEILENLAKGLPYKEIAIKMNVSPETIKTHIRNIYTKLHVNSNIEALIKYYNLGNN